MPARPRTIIAHGGVQYSYKVAAALHSAGLLRRFFTTIYAPPDSRLYRAAGRVLSRHRWAMALRGRRHEATISASVVSAVPWFEAGHRLWSAMTGGRSENAVLTMRNDLFDRYVARKLHREGGFDLFYGFSGGALHSLRRARAMGRPTVLDHHDIWHETARGLLAEEIALHPEFAETIPYWPPYEPYLQRLAQEDQVADYHLVLSSFARSTYERSGVAADRIAVIPLGVDTRMFSPAPRPPSRFRVLFVGAIGQRKGIKYLLEAMRRLALPDAELVLAGTILGSGKPLQPYARWFRHQGYVEPAGMADFYRSGSVFVLPSLWDSYGQVVVEAMACGLPVIVSENTAAHDVVRDGVDGFVVPIRDVDALADRLLLLYGDPERRAVMGRSAAIRAREFDLAHYARTLVAVLTAMWQTGRPAVGV